MVASSPAEEAQSNLEAQWDTVEKAAGDFSREDWVDELR